MDPDDGGLIRRKGAFVQIFRGWNSVVEARKDWRYLHGLWLEIEFMEEGSKAGCRQAEDDRMWRLGTWTRVSSSATSYLEGVYFQGMSNCEMEIGCPHHAVIIIAIE